MWGAVEVRVSRCAYAELWTGIETGWRMTPQEVGWGWECRLIRWGRAGLGSPNVTLPSFF